MLEEALAQAFGIQAVQSLRGSQILIQIWLLLLASFCFLFTHFCPFFGYHSEVMTQHLQYVIHSIKAGFQNKINIVIWQLISWLKGFKEGVC